VRKQALVRGRGLDSLYNVIYTKEGLSEKRSQEGIRRKLNCLGGQKRHGFTLERVDRRGGRKPNSKVSLVFPASFRTGGYCHPPLVANPWRGDLGARDPTCGYSDHRRKHPSEIKDPICMPNFLALIYAWEEGACKGNSQDHFAGAIKEVTIV